MWSIDRQTSWHSLLNPFTDEQPHVIAGHVSCRSTEICDIIAGRQNALILAGRPNIGKSTLIRYLQLPPTALWSWRNELEEGSDTCERLDAIHFVQIDLKPLLVDFKLEEDKLLDIFIRECTRALYQAYKPGETFSDLSLSGLYKLLALISDDATDETRYFLVLDNIERLGSLYMQHSNIKNDKKKPQEYGITLLDRCRAIRTIIDLIDEFKLFGFILSIESLPRARVVDQFTYISADLARFTTRTLQTFTLSDTRKFLAQHIRDFENGANTRNGSNSDLPDTSPLFSAEEQLLLLNLAGTHPHLLQQCCYYLFQFKAHSVQETGRQGREKEQLRSIIDEQVSTFLSRTWKRLQEAITNSNDSGKVEKQFQMFVTHCTTKKAEDTIDLPFWDSLDPELRYILYSEGIVRYDLFRPVQFPGEILRDYLVQQVKGKTKTSDVHLTPDSSEHNHWLHITRPGAEPKSIPLSKLEYRLLNTLLQNHRHCTEQKLIESAWEKGTERANFTQRLHKLRKKLEEQLNGIDIIENRYGGIYSLVHADWLQLD